MVADRGRLQHQRDRFTRGYEVSFDLRMRDREGRLFSSCCCSNGTTLPFDPSTFPNRTEIQRLAFAGRHARISSPTRFVAPMTLVGGGSVSG